jgi:sugar O-acyltransferase (sialic acid O-acetyltransferase NeuD family)
MIINYTNIQFMFTNNIIIFGVNDLAELAHFYFLHENRFGHNDPYPIAFTVNKEFIKEDTFKGLPVIPFEELESHYPSSEYKLFAPIADNKLREKIYNEGKEKGYKFISYISSKCTNFSSEIGKNCFILEDNTLQPFTKIGNNVVLWSGNHIGHHSIIEDNVFFTSHVVMSGHCHIKKGVFIGVNACIRDGVTIEENCIIGMGSVVTKNTDNNSTYIGSPAKKKE